MLNLLNKAIVATGVLLLSVFSVFSVFPSAQAHSDLVSSDPVAGASLEQIPESFSLTFNEELISIEGESVNTLTLQGIDGNRYELLAPTVMGAVLSAQVAGGEFPAGEFLLTYRVVSADGHPITGEITFSTQSSTTIDSEPFAPIRTQDIAPESPAPKSEPYLVIAGITLALIAVITIRKRSKSKRLSR